MPSEVLSGACACGLSTYLCTAGPPQHLDFCYCTTCQQVSGAPFMAWMGIPKSGFTLSGPISEIALSGIAKRSFCSKCGSNLTLQYECYPGKTHLAVATMQKTGWETPKVGVHIFVKSCPAWYQIPNDGVQKYEEFDPEFEEGFPEVVKALQKNV